MYILQRFSKQRLAATKWTSNIGPRIFNILERNKVDAKDLIAYWSGEAIYPVLSASGGSFIVNLGTQSCSCNKWNLSGIPCSHATVFGIKTKTPNIT